MLRVHKCAYTVPANACKQGLERVYTVLYAGHVINYAKEVLLVANLLEAKNLLNADKVSLNPLTWVPYILFVVIAFFIVGIGQNLKNKVSGRVPFLDGQVEPLTNAPMAGVQQTRFY